MNKINGIDVSECSCKDDDKCFEAPILNEYGDLIDYQDCESQTLCPYRSKIKIQRLQEENNILKQTIKNKNFVAIVEENEELKKKKDEYYLRTLDYEAKISYLIQALEEIRKEANRLLYEENPIYGYNNSNYFELLAKYVLAKTKEVLNDRD